MPLTDEQIRKLIQKDISCKTVIVSQEELEKVKTEHISDGWELVKISPFNNKYKITFKRDK